jgi:outer membrane protein assembly factor BamB
MSNQKHGLPARLARGAVPFVAVGTVAVALPVIVSGPAAAQALSFKSVWSQTVTDGRPISISSPNLAVLNGANAVVVGDQGGDVDAFTLASGAPVPGWPASTGGIPVESTPSVAALSAGSPDDTVFVGAGTAATPHEGGYEAFKPTGSKFWSVSIHNPGASFVSGIVASLAVGDLQGGTDVVAPSIGQQEDAINAATGKVLSGFPWFDGDGDYATPALADMYGTGKDNIVNGGGQTAGLAYEVHYTQGGHVSVTSRTGNAGTKSPNGGLMCSYNPNESVESSPAVGPFLAGGAEGIAVGTGDYFPGAPDSGVVVAVNSHCKLIWTTRLDGLTSSSPALANLMGNGKLDVVEGTDNQHGGGSVYALNATNGSVIWHQKINGEVIGGVVSANLGAGAQDVIVASTGGAWVLDGRTGQMLATLERGVGLQNCALVTDDPNGTIGITLAGYNNHNVGEVQHYEVAGSNGSVVDVPGAWPMFHHDRSLSGNATAPI